MEFKLPRQNISPELNSFYLKKLRQLRVYVLRATKNHLKGIAVVSRKIRKDGLPKHLVLKKLKGKLGHGIFLHPKAKTILKGEMIAPYSGDVFLAPQNGEDNSDYVFSLLDNLRLSRPEQLIWDPKSSYHPRRLYSIDLDAGKNGNFTRFINHSAKPNVEADFLRIPSSGQPQYEVIYIAKKTIRPGEQLLVCYEGKEKGYWGALGIKPLPMLPRTFRLDASLKILTSSKEKTS
jgi:hypothetical protein